MRRPLALALVLLATPLPAADPPPEFAALKYRLVGPFAGGRVSRACGVPGDPLTYYAATASGGVWKSGDGGLSWKSVFDDQPTSSIGSIAVAPSDPNVVYVGSGEANIRGNVAPGAGLFKSEDGGKSWKHVWKQIGQIGTVTVHPKNADVAFAAVLGHAFGPNAERGVYRTTDGGKNWKRVKFVNDETGCSDVALDPSNPRVVFAGFWQTRRRPWEHTSGGPGSDLFVSRDGGDTWVSLKKGAPKNGLPKGVWGRVGVAVAPSNSSRVYALVEAEDGGLFRSDDGGEEWKRITDDRRVRQRAWYYSTITVHPTNPDVVFLPQVDMLRSIDGGRTVHELRGFHHGDHHDLWIDPANPSRMIGANDGGVDVTLDAGRTWHAPALPISQCYHVSADNAVPYRVMANMQDLGTARGPSHSLDATGIGLRDWHSVGGGETGHAVADPSDPEVVYAGEYGGILTRYDHRTRQARNVTVNQFNPSGIDPAKMKVRFQWTAPVVISTHDPKTVYHAANVIFRTRDAGQTWEKVSDDLSRNDKQKQQWSGGPITGDNTGVEVYGTVFALAESPKQKGLLWAGTDDGRVHLSKDDAKTWTDVTANVPNLPDWGTVCCVEPSPHDAGTAFVVVRNYRMDDYRPYLWKTTDHGATWAVITDGLDPKVHLHAVREDPKKKGVLYLGTERGVMLSPDAGKTWRSLQLNLPTVPVHDLVVKDDDLVVGTHGRSIWILDDLTVVRASGAKAPEDAVHLYPVRPATRWYVGWAGPTASFTRRAAADNPDAGAAVWFALGAAAKGDVTVEVLDAAGKRVALAKGKVRGKDEPADKDEDDEDEPPKRVVKAERGLNRFVWDMTHDGATTIPGAKVDMGSAGARVPVAPGKYTLKLTAAGKTLTQPVEVRADPRHGAAGPPAAAFAEQEKLGLRVRDDITALSGTVARLRAVKRQLDLRKDLLKGRDDAKDLLKQSEALGKALDDVEGKLHNPKAKISYDIFAARGGAMLYSQLAWLLGNLTDADGAPTRAQLDLADELGKELAALTARFEALVTGDVARLNAAARALGVPDLYVPPVPPDRAGVGYTPGMPPPVTPADPDDRAAACRLLAAGRPALVRDDTARRFLDLLTTGEFDPAGLFVARGAGGAVRGAVLAQELPGALGLLFPPRVLPGREADLGPLLAAALDWLLGRGVKVCQSFAPGGDRSDESVLALGGFRHVTTVVHLRRALEPDHVGPDDALAFEPHGADAPAFTAALLASHDGSLDCPELTGARTPAELLDGFRGPPSARPDWWALARHAGEPVGVVMLDPGAEAGAVELNYLGLVPAARGRGWGEALVRFALRAAAADGARALTLSVDARNAPARRLYDRHGFREADRREVFLWCDPGPT